MGQFEKIVVLTVLSLIAVILVISFSTSEDPLAGIDGADVALAAGLEEAAGEPAPRPIAGRQRVPSAPPPEELDLRDPFQDRVSGGAEPELVWPEDEEDEASLLAHEPEAEPAAPPAGERLLLNSSVGRGSAEAAPARDPRLPEGSALLTLKGLEDTFDAELKLYTWRSGDSFEDLARRFYGDAGHAALLRLHNEGKRSVPAGDAILVPVFDHRGEAPARLSAGRTHLVQEGESLWAIAQKQYGRGNDWQRIFEANQDRLKSPDDVRAGMELRLP